MKLVINLNMSQFKASSRILCESYDEEPNLCVILLCSMKMKEMLSSSSSSSSSRVRTEEEEGEDGESQTTSGEMLGLEVVT